MDTIEKEATLRSSYINENISTVYFGGGTPSLIPIDNINALISQLKKIFSIEDDAEITLEANPDDITNAMLDGWKAAGINRLSIGVQSFIEEDLQWMNRAHSAQQAINSIVAAQQHGFNNITIDLIYGTPTLSDEQWKENVRIATSLNIPHLSCYALTIEEKTALNKMIIARKKENINNDTQARHFELLMEWMGNAGYEHYETSNFARPGKRSKHNSSYWQGKNYIGLGPSAHSFNGSSRQWNIANNALYIKSIEQNRVPFEIEHLTPTQQLNEYIMTSLRTIEGLSLNYISQKFGKEKSKAIIHSSQKWVQSGHILHQQQTLQLTSAGKLLTDKISADLFEPG